MSDKRIVLPESNDELVSKWQDVIECKEQWADIVGEAVKVDAKGEIILAKQLEILEQAVLESSSVADISLSKPTLISMVRRVAPALISNNVFGVQPMTAPTQQIFTLRSSYQGDSANGYKRNQTTILVLGSGDVAAGGYVLNGDIASSGTGVGKVRYIENDSMLVEVTAGVFVAAETVDNAATYAADAGTIAGVYENELAKDIIFKNYTGSMTTETGEFLGAGIKEIGFDVEGKDVTAKTRKLKARWSRELEDDLRNVHGIAAEQLLSSVATDEIVLEMNREVIDTIKANSTFTVAWDYATADGRWEIEKYQNLTATISRTSRQVAFRNRRGQANWLIVSPSALSALESTGRLSKVGIDPYNQTFAGVFNGMFKVFVDIYEEGDVIYMGYKGATEIDAGYYYAPYIPLRVTKGMGEEDDVPRLFFTTRYGLTENGFGAQNYFAKITIANLPS